MGITITSLQLQILFNSNCSSWYLSTFSFSFSTTRVSKVHDTSIILHYLLPFLRSTISGLEWSMILSVWIFISQRIFTFSFSDTFCGLRCSYRLSACSRFIGFTKLPIRSLSKDDGNGNDDARKQWSDWLNEETLSCCTCGTRFSTILWRSLSNDNVKFPNLKFYRQREHATVNLSFSIFTSTVLLPVHLLSQQ